jgi:hypothetical protein
LPYSSHLSGCPRRGAAENLEIQTGFARRIGQSLDAAVIQIAAAIEDHLLDALLLRALGDQLADFLAAATLPP